MKRGLAGSRKAKPTVAPVTLPSDAALRRWFLLPMAATRREAGAGGPIVIPVGGKRALAAIAWADDDGRQSRFVKAGRRNPYSLSRQEYLQLASTDNFWMNDEVIHDLLSFWAIRAAKREPQLAGLGDHSLGFMFTSQLIDFVLGRPDAGQLSGDAVYRERTAGTREPQEIVRRYLVSENWKLTVEAATLESQRNAGPRKGGRATLLKHRPKQLKILEMFKAMSEQHPRLTEYALIKRFVLPALEKLGDKSSYSAVARVVAKFSRKSPSTASPE